MRVAINGSFWDQSSTGSGQYLRELTAGLSGLGTIDPCLVVSASPQNPPPPRVTVCEMRARASGNVGKVWFEQVSYPTACKGCAADVAHVPYFAPPWHCDVPVVVTIHDLIPLLLPEYRGGWHVRAYMALARRAARRATLIVTDSEASANDIERVLGIPRPRVRVVYLAAGQQYRPLPAAQRDEARQRLALPAAYLFYLGGFDRRKNVPELLQAYRKALPRLRELPLVVAGQLPDSDSAFTPDPRRVVRELGLANHVHFLGHVPEQDKAPLYAGAVALVYPSRYEGFGLPPLEALSCGTPVIATRSSSLPEVVGDGGILVEPDNIDDLSAAMAAVAMDPALSTRLGQRGLAHAARFSWERVVTETVAVYEEAIARARQ